MAKKLMTTKSIQDSFSLEMDKKKTSVQKQQHLASSTEPPMAERCMDKQHYAVAQCMVYVTKEQKCVIQRPCSRTTETCGCFVQFVSLISGSTVPAPQTSGKQFLLNLALLLIKTQYYRTQALLGMERTMPHSFAKTLCLIYLHFYGFMRNN